MMFAKIFAMVFVGFHPTPHKGLSPLDPVSAKRSGVFQNNDALAWRAANTGFFLSIGLIRNPQGA